MSTTEIIEEPKFEVLPPDVATASTELSCPADKVAALYQPFAKPFEYAAELLAEEEKATTAFDARALRLKMVKARTTITATKDESKEGIKLDGKIIDWFNNAGCERLKESEARLLDIEKAEERAEAARIEALREERAEVLESLENFFHGNNLGTMAEADWKEYLQQAKDVYEMREIRKKREAEEAAAELKRQEEEREAARLEAIKLREEAEANAAAAKAEREAREKAEAAAREAAAAAEKARVAAENEAKKERDAIEAKAKAEQEKRDAAAKAERDRIEATAAEERRKAIEAAAVAAKEKAAAEAEAQRLRDAEAKRIADQKAKEDAQAKADALAAKKAAAAPDKAKLMTLFATLAEIPIPIMSSPEGKMIAASTAKQLADTMKMIEAQAATL